MKVDDKYFGEYEIGNTEGSMFQLLFDEPIGAVYCRGDEIMAGDFFIIWKISDDRKIVIIYPKGEGINSPTGQILPTGKHYLIEEPTL